MSLKDFAKHVGQWKTARVPTALLLELDSVNPNGGLKDTDLKVYIGLTTWGRGDGKVYARQSVIARWLGIARNTLWRSLTRLEKVEAITIGSIRVGEEDRKLITVVTPEGYKVDVPPVDHVPPVEQGVFHTGNMGVPPVDLIRKRKKEDKSKKRVSTFVETKTSTFEEANGEEEHEPDFDMRRLERVKKDQEKKERDAEAMKAGAASSFGNHAPLDTQPADDSREPPGRSPRSPRRSSGQPAKPKEIIDPKIIALHDAYLAEIKLKWPNAVELALNPMKAKLIRGLLDQTTHENLLEIIRVAVWDWDAIQETVQPWYTKDRELPDYKTLSFIFDQLAVLVGKGKTSTKHRTSDYRRRYIAKTLNNSSRDASGMSLAQRARREVWAAQDRRAEERRKEEEERDRQRYGEVKKDGTEG